MHDNDNDNVMHGLFIYYIKVDNISYQQWNKKTCNIQTLVLYWKRQKQTTFNCKIW